MTATNSKYHRQHRRSRPLQVTAHNRFWASDTTYAKQNGGEWDFFIDSKGNGNMAVPLEQAFWEWLLPMSANEWGMTTYE